ncbi:MAG: hypothetical protein H6Q51_2892 [Deltaproteobacteria bacterium]|nr:hypothetical protein [Deltaproteobacteria bacterium]
MIPFWRNSCRNAWYQVATAVTRGVKRKMSNFPLRRRDSKPLASINIKSCIRIST